MKTNWDLTVFYKDFDDPEFKDDLARLPKEIDAFTAAIAAPAEDEVKKLAAMPSKEVLIAQVLYSFNFPIMQLAIACDAIVKKAEGNEEMKVAELVAPKEAAAEEAAE